MSMSERLTVTLTAEQADHVREQLLADFASGLEQFVHADRGCLKDAHVHADTYRAKVEALDGSAPVAYADRRCELVQLADDLMEKGADRAKANVPFGDAGADEGIPRERARQLAPALTGVAILAQVDGEAR